MSKMSTELVRHALNGPTMGTRWSALFFAAPGFDPAPVRAALQAAVDEVDAQMSTWKPDSDLMRLNAAPVGEWVAVPARLMEVLRLGLEIGRASGGAFDIGMGDAVTAWGFGPEAAAPDRIRSAMAAPRRPAHEVLETRRRRRVRKSAARRARSERHRQGLRRRSAGRDPARPRDRRRARRHRWRDARARPAARTARPGPSPWRRRTRSAARRIRSSRFRTPPSRPRATTATGSRCRDVACRIRWTRARGAPLLASPASVTRRRADLRRGRRLGDRAHGARRGRRRAAGPTARPRRPVPAPLGGGKSGLRVRDPCSPGCQWPGPRKPHR